MISKDLKVINKLGLHARAAAKVVDIANRYKCEINLLKDDKKADARSIMKILMLSASQGTYIKVQISGDNQDDAMSSIERLFNEKFNEEE